MWWWPKWRARRRLVHQLNLWYHPDYSAPAIPLERQVAHLQTDRAKKALARLTQLELLTPSDIKSAPVATFEDLERVHSMRYLEQLAEPEALGQIFGLPPDMVDSDALLLAQRRATGGTMAAAEAAVLGQARMCFNLGGGFHHAMPDAGAGFCIFNDVAVAIAALRARGFCEPIAIVDLDFHQGDGNLAAFEHDPSVLVYSIHGSVWSDRLSAACRNFLLPSGTTDEAYLACLDDHLLSDLESHGTKLIFYLAGVDVLVGDTLGDFSLSPAGVLLRDRRIMAYAESLGVPMVVTMAGGYSASAWQCTSNFIRWILTGIKQVDREPHAKLRYRFLQVSREIDPWDLQEDDTELDISESDLLLGIGHRPRRLLLGFYSRHGIELALDRYGLLAKLRASGFSDLQVEVNPPGSVNEIIRMSGRKETPKVTDEEASSSPSPSKTYVLAEIVLSRRQLTPPATLGDPSISALGIEWLLLQDPTARFTVARPRLPGQEFPGLGFAHDLHELLVRICVRLRFEAIVHSPAHYHNAVVVAREYRFIDPVLEGRFRAVRRTLAGLSLSAATLYIDQGLLRLADGTPYLWEPGEVLLPVSSRLKAYFTTRYYTKTCHEAMQALLSQGLKTTNIKSAWR